MGSKESKRPVDGFVEQVYKIIDSKRVNRRHITLLGQSVATSLIAQDLHTLAVLFENEQRKILQPDENFDTPMSQGMRERLMGSHMVLTSGAGIILAMQDIPKDVRTDPYFDGLNANSQEREYRQIDDSGTFEALVHHTLTKRDLDAFKVIPYFVAKAIVNTDSDSLASMYEKLVWLECATNKGQIRRITTGVLDVARPALDKMQFLNYTKEKL